MVDHSRMPDGEIRERFEDGGALQLNLGDHGSVRWLLWNRAESPGIDSVAELEEALEQCTVLDDAEQRPSVVYFPVPDTAWLACQRLGFYRTKTTLTDRAPSISGLLEDFDGCDGLSMALWTVRQAQSTDVEVCRMRHPKCPDWTRSRLSYLPSRRDATLPPKVRWVDMRADGPEAGAFCLPTSASVVYFLQGLLGCAHTASPWVEEATNSDSDDCILLFFPSRAPEKLVSFRVSDACPSWCLYSSILMELPTDQIYPWRASNGTRTLARSPCELLVFRRLPSRERLSSLHPVTRDPVPVDGCLWETIVTLPKDAVDSSKPIITFGLAAPPYINYRAEYDTSTWDVRRLLEPAAQQILREEAARIPQWTAWPEQQHYRASTDNGPAPWTVFPLCHCFPAHDLSRRQWVDATAAQVPLTVQLLKEFAGDTLRTALFSRLDPDSVLEAHTGWADLANHVYRVHVPIDIPDGHLCGTWVDGCVATHEADQLVAFDDSKTHRAFNYSAHSRVVLILDLARPAHLPPGTATGGHSEELDSFISQFATPK